MSCDHWRWPIVLLSIRGQMSGINRSEFDLTILDKIYIVALKVIDPHLEHFSRHLN